MNLKRAAKVVLGLAPLLAVAHASGHEPECRRLVEVLPATTYARGVHEAALAAPASSSAEVFLIVSGPGPGKVELDGRTVVQAAQLAGPRRDHLTLQVALRTPTSRLRVTVPGQQGTLTVRVVALVAASDLPDGVGLPVGRVMLFERVLNGGTPPENRVDTVPGPGADGVVRLSVDQGESRASLARVQWNDEAVLGPQPIRDGEDRASAPVIALAQNQLESWVLGTPGSSVVVRVVGDVVDPTPPTATWESPADHAIVSPDDVLRLAFSDVGTGIPQDGLVITAGVGAAAVDVTSRFTRTAGAATCTVASLADVLGSGAEVEVRARVRDRACNEAVSVLHVRLVTAPTIAIDFPAQDACVGPSAVVRVTFGGIGFLPASFVARVNGQDRTQAFTVTATGADAPASALTDALAQGRNEVSCTISNVLQDSAAATVSFDFDSIGPAIAVVPTNGTVTTMVETVTIEYSDAGGCGVELGSVHATLDGAPLVLIVGATEATATVTLGEGAHTLTAHVADEVGNASSTSATFVVDRTPPVLAFASPTSGSFTGPDHQVTLTYSDGLSTVDLASVRLELNGADVSGALLVEAATASVRLGALSATAFVEGPNMLRATARDAGGNEVVATVEFVHDRLPPLLVFDPPPATPLSARQPTSLLSIGWVDVGSGAEPSTFRAFLDGVEITNQFVVGPTAATTTVTLNVGEHELAARISDVVGNASVATTRFLVDGTSPQVALTGPVDCAGPSDRLTITVSDDSSGLAGSSEILVAGNDVSALLVHGAGTSVLELGDLDPAELPEGDVVVHVSARDRAGNVGTATIMVRFDRTPPTLALEPVEGTHDSDALPLVASYADLLCGVEPSSFVATLDGIDITAHFAVGPARADAPSVALADGQHVFSVRLSDHARNEIVQSVTFTVAARAVGYELTLSPGNPAGVLIDTENDLVIRAVTASGRTASTHARTVLVEASDGLPPLHGLVATFDPARDQGLRTLPRLALFRTPGPHTITARALPDASGSVPTGSLTLEVVLNAPQLVTEVPAATNAQSLVLGGVSFPGGVVQLIVNGQVVQQTVAASNGSFTFTLALAGEGDYTLLVSGFDASTGTFVSSPPVLTRVDRSSPASVTITSPTPRAIVANRVAVRGTAEPDARVAIHEGGTLLGSAIALGGAFEVPVQLTSGAHVLMATATDAAGNPSGVASVRVTSGAAPVWGRVLDGDTHPPQPIAGVPIRLGALATITDASGRFVFADAPVGRDVLSVNAPRASGRARLDLPSFALPDRVDAHAMILLPSIPPEIEVALPVDETGRVLADVQVESSRVPGARIAVTAGTHVSGEGADAPRLAIRPVDPAHTPLPFPPGFRPLTLWEVSPSGLSFTPGVALRLPNVDRFAPGAQVPLMALKATQGGWVQVGVAIVDPTGDFLDSGPVLGSFSLFGTSSTDVVSTRLRLRVEGTGGEPIDGAAVSIDGELLVGLGGGLYERSDLILPIGRPPRAIVGFDDDGIFIIGETDPIRWTRTNGGTSNVVVGFAASAGIIAGGGQAPDPATGAPAVSVNSPATDGAPRQAPGAGPTDPAIRVGFLNLFFSEPDAPPVAAIVEVPETTALTPETARLVPFVVETSDPNGATIDLVSAEYSLDGGGSFVSADLVLGDQTALLASPEGGKRHLFYWDVQGANGLGLVDLAQAVLRVSVVDPDGNAFTSAPSTSFFVRTGQVTADPATVDLGEVDRPSNGVRTVTIRSAPTSQVAIEVRSIALTGPDAPRFSLVGAPTLPRSLDPGEAITFDVAFDGSAPEDTYGAVVEVVTSTPGDPLRIPVAAATASPTISVTPATLDLGTVGSPLSTSDRELTINNTSGRRDLVVSSIQLTGDFSIPGLALPLVILPGQFATVPVRFVPSGPGDAIGDVTIFSNDPDAPRVSLALLGRGQWPIPRVDPTSVDFGTTIVSTTTIGAVRISNLLPANVPLTVSNVTLADSGGGVFAVSVAPQPLTILPGETLSLQVAFTPSGAQSFAGSIVVATDDPVAPTVSVSLTGIAVEALAGLSPASPFSYGLHRVGDPAIQTFVLKNDDASIAPLVVTGLSAPGSADFTVVRDGVTGETLVPGQSASFDVRFEAGRVVDDAALRIEVQTDQGPVELLLTARAGEPDVVVRPTSFDFADVRVGESASTTITVENSATATYPLTVSSLAPPGGSGVFQLAGPFATPKTLLPGEAATFDVTFTPSAADAVPLAAELVVVTDDPDAPNTSVALGGRGTRPFARVAPLAVDFGTVADGAERKAWVAIENVAPANAPLAVTVELADDGEGAFSIEPSGALPDLAAGARVDLLVRYTPRPGLSTGTILVQTDDPDSPDFSISLHANGVLPALVLAAPALEFGLARVGFGRTLPFEISNHSSATADLVGVLRVATGRDAFSLGALEQVAVSVRPGKTATVDVTFTAPGEALLFSGALEFDSDDPHRPLVTIPLTASAGIPRLDVVASLDVGAARPGEEASADLLLKNAGTYPVELTEVTLVDSQGGVFTLTAPDLSVPVAPGAEAVASVRFVPLDLVSYRGLVVVIANDQASPRSVDLLGRGALPELLVAPSFTFPTARVGAEVPDALRLENASSVPLLVSSAQVTLGAAFRVVGLADGTPFPATGLSIPAGGSADLVLAFAPTVAGPIAGTLELGTDDPRQPLMTVALEGTGTFGTIELTLLPGPATGLTAASLHRVRAHAVLGAGGTDTAFEGLVELQTTDPLSPLNGLVFLFTAADQGDVTSPELPAFFTHGTHTITASLLLPDATPVLGTLAVEVLPAERGRVFALLPSGSSGGSLALAPGAQLDVRVIVDAGPSDGDLATLEDTLGAYDLRLLFDTRALEVVSVRGGSSPLGAPLITQLAGEAGGATSLRLQDLNETGTLAASIGPDPGATGVLEVAVVTLRVREQAPGGRSPIAVAVDLLTTARSVEPSCVEALGAATPRPGIVAGGLTVAVPDTGAALHVLGTLPRTGEALVGPLPAPAPGAYPAVEVVFSRPVDLASLEGRFTLEQGGTFVAGAVEPGSDAFSARLVPASSLAEGAYVVRVGASSLDTSGQALGSEVSFVLRVGPVPAPLSHDLDQDGEVTVADFQIRRCRGTSVNFPPVFVAGAPAGLSLPEGAAFSHTVVVLDPEGQPVVLETPGAPAFARAEPVGSSALGDTFVVLLDPDFDQAGAHAVPLVASDPDGATSTATLNVAVTNTNRGPSLSPLEPARVFLAVDEGGELTFTCQASDPDLSDATFPDELTFGLESSVANLEAPPASGTTASFTFRPDHTQAGEHEVKVSVRDRAGARAELTYSILVKDENLLPTLALVSPALAPGERLTATLGVPVTLVYEASDPDGDPLDVVLRGETLRDLEDQAARGLLNFVLGPLEQVAPQQAGESRVRRTITFTQTSLDPRDAFPDHTLLAEATDLKAFSPPVSVALDPQGAVADQQFRNRKNLRADWFTVLRATSVTPNVWRVQLEVFHRGVGTVTGLSLPGFALERLDVLSNRVLGSFVTTQDPGLPRDVTATLGTSTGDYPVVVRLTAPTGLDEDPVVLALDGAPPPAAGTRDVGTLVLVRVRAPRDVSGVTVSVTGGLVSFFDFALGQPELVLDPSSPDHVLVTLQVALRGTPGATGELRARTSSSITGFTRSSEAVAVRLAPDGPPGSSLYLARIAHRASGAYLEPTSDPYLLPEGAPLASQSLGPDNPFVVYWVLDTGPGLSNGELELSVSRDGLPLGGARSEELSLRRVPLAPGTLPFVRDGVETGTYLISPPVLLGWRAKDPADPDPWLTLPGGGLGVSIGGTKPYFIDSTTTDTEVFPVAGRENVTEALLARAIVGGAGSPTTLRLAPARPLVPGYQLLEGTSVDTFRPLDYAIKKDTTLRVVDYYPFPGFSGVANPFRTIHDSGEGTPTRSSVQVGFNRRRMILQTGASSVAFAPLLEDAGFLLYEDDDPSTLEDEGYVPSPDVANVTVTLEGQTFDTADGQLLVHLREEGIPGSVSDRDASRFLRAERLAPHGILRSQSLVVALSGAASATFLDDALHKIRFAPSPHVEGLGLNACLEFLQAAGSLEVIGDQQFPDLVANTFDESDGRFDQVSQPGAHAHLFATQAFPAMALFSEAQKTNTPGVDEPTLGILDSLFGISTRVDYTIGNLFNISSPAFVAGHRLRRPTLFVRVPAMMGPLLRSQSPVFAPTGDLGVLGTLPMATHAIGNTLHGLMVMSVAGGDGVGLTLAGTQPQDAFAVTIGIGRDVILRPMSIRGPLNPPLAGSTRLDHFLFTLEKLNVPAIRDDPTSKLRVLNMSFAIPVPYTAASGTIDSIEAQLARLAEAGVILVAAAGNDFQNYLWDPRPNQDAPTYSPLTALVPGVTRLEMWPAAFSPANDTRRSSLTGANRWRRRMITVGSSIFSFGTSPDVFAPHSNIGHHVNLLAPGEVVRAGVDDFADPGAVALATPTGTSFAAPQVSALLTQILRTPYPVRTSGGLSTRPPTPDEAIAIVETTADFLGQIFPSTNQQTPPFDLARLYEGHGRMNAWKAALAAVNGGLAEHRYPFMKRERRRKGRDEPFVAPLPIITNSETLYYGFQVHTQDKASIWLTHTVNGNRVAAELVYSRPHFVPGVAAIVTAVRTYQGVPLPLSPSPEPGAGPHDENLHTPIPLGLAHFQTQNADRSFVAQFTLRSDQIPPRASSPRLELHRGPIRGPGTMILAVTLDPELMRRPPSAARLIDPIVADNVRFDDFVFYVSDVPFPRR